MFSLPVCMGMASLALDLPVSNDEALQGLVLPAAAFVILGKAGGCPFFVTYPGWPVAVRCTQWRACREDLSLDSLSGNLKSACMSGRHPVTSICDI